MDYLCTTIYLLFLLAIGMVQQQHIKTLRDYAIADQSFNTASLVMTFLATSFGVGSILGDISRLMKDGIIFYIGMSGFFIFSITMIKYIAPHFDERFKNMISAGDMMRYFYGSRVEKFTAICGFFVSVLAITAQITVLGYIVGYFFDIDYKLITLIIGVILIIYSTLGGVKAVTATDVFQLSIIATITPFITLTIIEYAGGLEYVIKTAYERELYSSNQENFIEYTLLFIVGALPFLWIYPPLIQRFLMVKTYNQISTMYTVELIVRPLLMIMVILIACSALIVFPDIEHDEVMYTILEHMEGEGIKGIIVVMILAVGMSTADSHLNAGAVLITNAFFREEKEETKLKVVRILSILVGTSSLMLSMGVFDTVEIIILAFGIWGAAIGIPLMAGILRFHICRTGFWLGSVFSILSMVISLLYFNDMRIIIPCIGIIVGGVGFLLPHFKIKILSLF